jgi:hypothetical protein
MVRGHFCEKLGSQARQGLTGWGAAGHDVTTGRDPDCPSAVVVGVRLIPAIQFACLVLGRLARCRCPLAMVPDRSIRPWRSGSRFVTRLRLVVTWRGLDLCGPKR